MAAMQNEGGNRNAFDWRSIQSAKNRSICNRLGLPQN
jgi:hypothetical protein